MDYKLIYKPSTVLEAIMLTINVISVCISSSAAPVLSTGTKIIPVPAFLIPVPVLDLKLEQ